MKSTALLSEPALTVQCMIDVDVPSRPSYQSHRFFRAIRITAVEMLHSSHPRREAVCKPNPAIVLFVTLAER